MQDTHRKDLYCHFLVLLPTSSWNTVPGLPRIGHHSASDPLYMTTCVCQQAASRAGKWWAVLITWVLSPLLLAVFGYILLSLSRKGPSNGFIATVLGCAAWPGMKIWGGIKCTGRLLHPSGLLVHVILLLARKSHYRRPPASGLF